MITRVGGRQEQAAILPERLQPTVRIVAPHDQSKVSANASPCALLSARPSMRRRLETRRMNEEAGYIIEMNVGADGMKCPMAGTALALRDAARARIAARIAEPSVEQ